MPIYEYECQTCCRHFEKRQSYTDKPVETCPHCQGTVRRVLCPAPIIFKGSGFYVTDSRKGTPSESGDSLRRQKKLKSSISKSRTDI